MSMLEDVWYVCQTAQSEELLLIWDYWNRKIWHTYWDNLTEIPVEEWYCINCRNQQNAIIAETDDEINDPELRIKSKKFANIMN